MHLRPIWKGKLIWENALPIFERLPNASALTQLAPASLCSDVSAPCPDTSTRRRVCTDASVPTRPRRRVHAPTRLHRRVCSDTSGPTRLRRRVCADASPLACQNMDFRSKTLIPLETSSQNSKKHQAKSLVLQKMITPIAIAEFPR